MQCVISNHNTVPAWCHPQSDDIARSRVCLKAEFLFHTSVTQMFLMPLFFKVESGSSKLLRTVPKSGPNGCKERSRPQKMLMRIKIESFLGRQKCRLRAELLVASDCACNQIKKILVFKKGKRRVNEHWFYGNFEIQQTHSIPYLGIVFTQGGAINTVHNRISEQALKATFHLKKK